MGRPKGSKNKKFSELRAKMPVESQKRAAEKTKEMLAEIEEESEVVVSKRDSASTKWNAMTLEQRKETVQSMMNCGVIPSSLKRCVADLFCGREEEGTMFGDLLFDMQGAVSIYLKKR